MFRRLLLGLLKGLVIGAAIGALMHFALGVTVVAAGALSYLFFGLVAALAGVASGQPPWREGAWVGSILKGIFGFAIGAGLYWVGQRFLNFDISGLGGVFPQGATFAQAPLTFAPAVAALFATLIELDDGGDAPAADAKTGVRVDAGSKKGADLDLDEIEESASTSKRAKK